MKTNQDTIAAIATAPGEAGIAVVRISGPESLGIADAVFRGSRPPLLQRPSGTFCHGFIRTEAGNRPRRDLDEVIVLVYRAPHSYTREDVIEIQCHGGRASARRILDTVLMAGARLAEPGEFTKRAFLNGRIDLLQAEAVADLIRAQSDRAAGAAMEQLEGNLSLSFGSLYDDLLSVASDMEASLDFLEDELPPTTMADLCARLTRSRSKAEELLGTWDEGHVLREGALVVICGKPNVGKSTLLNALLGKSRAIVTEVPGTTRDTIEESVVMEGFPVRLVDTAGLRATDCQVEREGVVRAEALMAKADLVAYMIDCSAELGTDDRKALVDLKPERTLVVLNKTDLGVRVQPKDVTPHRGVLCSLTHGKGLEEIRSALVSKLGVRGGEEVRAVISGRHRQIIQYALNAMNEALTLLSTGKDDTILLAADALRDALNELGKASGKTYTEDLLNAIFGRFCVGK
jgi:tRNA modification GTPase